MLSKDLGLASHNFTLVMEVMISLNPIKRHVIHHHCIEE
jgi:hypothetical protein